MPRAHIAIDLETLSTAPNAAIISIGAVAICEATGDKRSFYIGVDQSTQLEHSHQSKSTMQWWSGQSGEARVALDYAFDGLAPSINHALGALTDWVMAIGETHNDVFVWGNGATFDITILESAYHNYGGTLPWNFRKTRDMRTLYEITNMFGLADDIRSQVQRTGVHHNALDDADYQARIVITSMQLLRGCASSIKLADKLALEMLK